jgi:uncharacterized protein YjiS (DUF1127 family)
VRYGDRDWRLVIANLSGTASGYAGGPRNRWMTRAQAIDELREVAVDDPAVLADTVAMYVTGPRDWWTGDAVQLLLDAGADPDLVVDYIETWQAKRRGTFSLGALAERLSDTF